MTTLTPPQTSGPLQQRPYRYKMIQIAPSVMVKASQQQGQEAATYLEEIVNQWSASGWEFYRVDTMSIHAMQGCLSALFGGQESVTHYYVVTFRRPA